MKKAFALLLALALVGGAVFAQEASLSGSATLTWGMNLDTNSTGFTNAATAKVTIPFAVDAKTTDGEGVHGYISVSNITFKLTDNPLTAGDALGFTDVDSTDDEDPASLTAKIVADNLYMMVYNYSTLNAKNYASDLLDGEVASDIDASAAGTKIGITGDYALALILNSAAVDVDDFTGNEDNYYSVGVNAVLKLVPDLLTADILFAYDMLDATNEMYIGGKFPVTLGDLTLTPAFDVAMPDGADMMFDAKLTAAYDLTDTTNVTFKAYYGGDEDLEVALDFEEDGGMVENLFLGAGFGYYNALETAVVASWDAYLDLEYTVALEGDNYVMPYAYFTIDSAELKTLNVGAEAGVIPNTTFTLDWATDDLDTSNGLLRFITKIKL